MPKIVPKVFSPGHSFLNPTLHVTSWHMEAKRLGALEKLLVGFWPKQPASVSEYASRPFVLVESKKGIPVLTIGRGIFK